MKSLYNRAVNKVQSKIIEDIDRYFERLDDLPTLDQYYHDRKNFLQQIWQNIWVNVVQGAYSIKERKQYLIEKGVQFESADKKLVKKLFQSEIKDAYSFDVEQWLNDTFSVAAWEKKFFEIKEMQLKREEERKLEAMREEQELILEELAEQWLSNNAKKLYIYIRYKIALEVKKDMEERPKYKITGKGWENQRLVEMGKFLPTDYQTLGDFFAEFTGDYIQEYDWGRLYYDFELFGDVYFRYLSEILYQMIDIYSKNEIKQFFEEKVQFAVECFQDHTWVTLFEGPIVSVIEKFYDLLVQEYVEDMLEITNEPFQFSEQLTLYEKQEKRKEQRRITEQLERKRKEQEEQQIIRDVFEREMASKGQATNYILHIGDTNTGKTFHALESLKQAKSGCYLAPLRLLALEVYDKLNREGVPCSLKTGEEEKIVSGATHISCTVEMFHEKDSYECIVIDEAQMMADKERGFSWYRAITGANAKEVHIIGSKNIKEMLLNLVEGNVTLHEYVRDTPLKVEKQKFSIEQTKNGDALICFSRKKVIETASFLERSGKKVSIIYGSMPPETRKLQIERFIDGDTSVIVSTDAIGMGLNLPINRVVFLENEKFDGTTRRRLTSQEVKQIAGRAGRKGLYNVGKVAFTSDTHLMKKLLEKEDNPLTTFTIAPTNVMLERFQKYSRHLGTFFEYWKKFKNPKGTVKASLSQERELYQLIEGTEIEARLSMMDLYGFLHLPFSTSEHTLLKQWVESMTAIVNNEELPEPIIQRDSLEKVELTYKAIGLHLLFLYRLERKTEALYWERLRREISEEANDYLKKTVKSYKRRCKRCGKKLPFHHQYAICDRCYERRFFYF